MLKSAEGMISRTEALAQGLKRYIGAPCKRGHSGERRTATRNCIACDKERDVANKEKIREKGRAYRAANKEKIREQRIAHRAANKEKIREANAAYYAANRERERERCAAYQAANKERAREAKRAWCKANPGAVRAKDARRRALEKGARCTCCTDAEIKAIHDIAALCGAGAHVDHIIPLYLGGLDCAKNLVALTAADHRKKTSKLDAGPIAAARRRKKLAAQGTCA